MKDNKKTVKAVGAVLLLVVYTVLVASVTFCCVYFGGVSLSSSEYGVKKQGEDADNVYFHGDILNSGMIYTGYTADYVENVLYIKIKGRLNLGNAKIPRGSFDIAVGKDQVTDEVVFIGRSPQDIAAAFNIQKSRRITQGNAGIPQANIQDVLEEYKVEESIEKEVEK
ncbi:MAG: hypothetical protein IJL89_01645 [Firmicutes bacterium]|nr:hypothetical protein [Bacillota bacterium]